MFDQVLPKGITGFFSIKDFDSEYLELDKEIVARLADELASGLSSYKKSVVLDSGASGNYYTIYLLFENIKSKIAIVLNEHYPVFTGLNKAESSWDYLVFCELPHEIISVAQALGFTYLPLSYLYSRPEERFLMKLDEVEKNQIRYWKPENVGNIIFNGWD